ncbi:hypothetical protein LJU32_22460 [Pseudomonas sp. B21_DOA]|nr:hypothetical protein LJU32_22460 [Pseudomonas sp. B21_DOA]
MIDVGVLADEVRKATGRFLGLRRIRATQIYWSTPGTIKIRVRGQGQALLAVVQHQPRRVRFPPAAAAVRGAI